MTKGDKQREIQSKYRRIMREKKEVPEKKGIFFIILLMVLLICNLLFKGF
ncbi:hypothetical protein ACFWM3_22915 [Gottfriedia sp. NPDC058432]|nr:hypothetical protein [Bacillus sp. FJAT-25509]